VLSVHSGRPMGRRPVADTDHGDTSLVIGARPHARPGPLTGLATSHADPSADCAQGPGRPLLDFGHRGRMSFIFGRHDGEVSGDEFGLGGSPPRASSHRAQRSQPDKHDRWLWELASPAGRPPNQADRAQPIHRGLRHRHSHGVFRRVTLPTLGVGARPWARLRSGAGGLQPVCPSTVDSSERPARGKWVRCSRPGWVTLSHA
jgi:hypothetical protein